MKVVQQCIYFPPEVGGLESHAYYLCRELARRGNEVTMVTSRSRREAPRAEIMDGVDVVRTWFPGKHPFGWGLHTFGSVPVLLRLARDADVLHAQTFASAPPGMLGRRLYRKPLVVTLHTSHFLRLAAKPAWQPVLRRIVAAADWLLAASEEIRDVALDLYAHPRAEAVTNGVDTGMFRPHLDGGVAVAPGLPPLPPGRRRIIAPRRLYEKNGVEYLVRALPRVRRALDVDALLVGDGPERSRLEALARELDVAEFVHFLGARPNSEMPALLSSAEVAVFPSLIEATSVAALEALSCERPVAASRVGGLPELIDAEVGTLFRPADPENLAAELIALLRRPDLREAGRRGRVRVVERWSLERLARRHEEIYQTLVAERRATLPSAPPDESRNR